MVPRINQRLAIVAVAAMGALSLLFGVLLAAAGALSAAKYFLLFALTMALVVALGVTLRVDRSGRPLTATTTTDHVAPHGTVPATQIRYARQQFRLMVALTSTCAVFCILAAVEIYANVDDDDFPGAAIAIALLGSFFASFVLDAATGRLRTGHLLLSAHGVAHRGWCFESRLDWSSIVGSTPTHQDGQRILLVADATAEWHRRYTTRLWRIEFLPPMPMIDVDCRRFDVDPRALYAYLSHYLDTPAARLELGTDAAVARARTPNLPR